ncbi:MAG: hypothetical protein IIB04_01070, partial [Acidobacteria bacterium]|nr:hypothetical protein [Acidobacteriota bacterium]
AFNNTHGARLGGHVIAAAIERAGVEPAEVEDVIMGCGVPEGATGHNIARQCAISARLPVTTAGVTVNLATGTATDGFGATDTLISITVVGTYIGLSRDTATANDTIEAPLSPRPRSSAPINDFERARFDSGGCSKPDGLTTKRVQWVLNDNLVDVVLVTGDAVSASQWEQTWNIVSSLAAGAPEGDRTQGICISTAPPDPGFSAPEPYYADPFWEFDLWYGTADLWTILPRQGFEYGPRKSIWWSVEFAGWPTEPSPEIAVTWRRIDVLDGETIVSDHPGTNAFTPEDGLLMIAGIDPRINGCWEVTATYKGASLSYVYERFQVRRETSTPKSTSP